MFNVSNKFVPNNILNLFKKIPDIHIYSTQAVIALKNYSNYSNLKIQRNYLPYYNYMLFKCFKF